MSKLDESKFFYTLNTQYTGLQKELIEKMEKEFNDYVDELLLEDKATIILQSDKTAIREEFLNAFALYYPANETSLDDLMKRNKPLSYLTDSFMKFNYAEYGSCQQFLTELYEDENYHKPEDEDAFEIDLEN